ncbi:MAG: transposase, partial [Dehalococcoidia bacterium]
MQSRNTRLTELAQASRHRWLRRCRKKPWVVYSQAPFAGPRKLLDYLGRYTHRVAISNHRILSCRGGEVRYRYRDRRDGDRLKTDLLPAEEFLRRFLQHVLPDRFLRIRHYGLLANCVKHVYGLGWFRAAVASTAKRVATASGNHWVVV